MDYIAENLEKIREDIAKAASVSGRRPEDITLVGVTKTIEVDRISRLLALGVKNLGENRVQEFLAKYNAFTMPPVWHFIGHLQTNKVKQIIGKVQLIQSVDSLRLAQEINRCAKEKDCVVDILIELNIAGEETKFGAKEADAFDLVEKICLFNNLRIKGLMTVAPYVEKEEDNRIFFRKMNQIFVDIKDRYRDNVSMVHLSMGMSNDYRTAITEGANMIRIGTGIFGKRE